MKVGIDVRSTLKRKTGIGYYTLNLINHLAEVDGDSAYFLYGFARLFDIKRRMPYRPGPNFRNRLQRLRFRPDISMRDMDVFHTSSYDIPPFEATRLVTTIHDIIPLMYSEGYPEEVLRGLENSIERVIQTSKAIVVDSVHTKNDLVGRFSCDAGRIRVVYPGRDESFGPLADKKHIASILRERYGIDRKFILFVGTVEKRKNVANLIRAFCELKNKSTWPHLLVLIGMKGWGSEATDELLSDPRAKRDIRYIGYIDRRDIPLFYNAADAFVYPSSYEGFGFPILEAFSCGTPTVTSRATSCGEIAGDAALTVENPEDIGELAAAIDRLLSDDKLSTSLQDKGRQRVRLFSWRDAAEQFKQIFREVT